MLESLAHGPKRLSELARVEVGGRAFRVETRPDTKELAGTAFGRMLAEVRTNTDKQAIVDRWAASVEGWPVIEGDRVIFTYRGDAGDVAIAGDLIGVALAR